MKRYITLLFLFIIYSSAFSNSIDTLWEHDLPPKDITYINCSKDYTYLHHFNYYHFLFEKVGEKYIHYELPEMAPFYRFTYDNKIIGYKPKDTITVYDCADKSLKIYDVKFLIDFTHWSLTYITSKTFAICDQTNAGRLKIYDLETMQLISELSDNNLMPVKKVFLSKDEAFLLGTLDGPKLAKYDLITNSVKYKINMNDWQEPKYEALFVNDSIAVVYCDFFKDFMTINTNIGRIIFEDTCDYYYPLSAFTEVRGDNTFIMHDLWNPPYIGRANKHVLINWLTGERRDFNYNDYFSISITPKDTVLLRKDFDNTERCVLYFHNLVTDIRDTIYNEYIIDTLFNQGTPRQIYNESNTMCNSYMDSTYIYSLDKCQKIKLLEVSGLKYGFAAQYNDHSILLNTAYSATMDTYKLYDFNTNRIEKEFHVNNKANPNFYNNNQYCIFYYDDYSTGIYDYLNDTVIYNTPDYLKLSCNGAFFEYDMETLGNKLYKHIFTYIPENDTSKKREFEYTFYADTFKTAYIKALTVDVSVDRKYLIYPNYKNYIIKVDLENNTLDSCLIDITPISIFFSKDGRYFQVRDSNNFKIYNYSTNELELSYRKTRQYNEISGLYMNYLILYSDTLRKMYCVRLNLENLGFEEQITTEDKQLFQIYPNPANNLININAKSEIPIYSIEVYNLRGEQMYRIKNIYSQKYSLDINNYPIGVYYIKINGVTEIFVKE